MGKGQVFSAESHITYDERTGARIRQVTDAPAIHMHPYYYTPAYDDAMRWLVFTSRRTGSPQLFAEDRSSGDIIQLTERDDVHEGSISPSPDGDYVYFSAGPAAWRINLGTLAEEELLAASDIADREGARLKPSGGHAGLSRDGHWLALTFGGGEDTYLAILDTASGAWDIILRGPIGHCQFCPDDSSLLWYGRSLQDRVWAIARDGSDNRRLYQREPHEWVTHESWMAGTREVVFALWPHGLRAVQADTRAVRYVTSFNAWHASCNRQGTWMVSDTAFPDIGLQIFDPGDGIGAPTTLCHPEASCLGDHWKGPFPYADGPIPIYAPPQTHPHPSFSPDGRYVVYTSDRSHRIEESQIYEVEVPAEYRPS